LPCYFFQNLPFCQLNPSIGIQQNDPTVFLWFVRKIDARIEALERNSGMV